MAELRVFVPAAAEASLPVKYGKKPPEERTDTYIVVDDCVGLKERGGGGLEIKICSGKMQGYEFFSKSQVNAGEGRSAGAENAIATLLANGEVSDERCARIRSWERVSLTKSRRRKKLKQYGLKCEVTEVTATPLDGDGAPSLWRSFCFEGDPDMIQKYFEVRLSLSPKPNVCFDTAFGIVISAQNKGLHSAWRSIVQLEGALLMGYPGFVASLSRSPPTATAPMSKPSAPTPPQPAPIATEASPLIQQPHDSATIASASSGPLIFVTIVLLAVVALLVRTIPS